MKDYTKVSILQSLTNEHEKVLHNTSLVFQTFIPILTVGIYKTSVIIPQKMAFAAITADITNEKVSNLCALTQQIINDERSVNAHMMEAIVDDKISKKFKHTLLTLLRKR